MEDESFPINKGVTIIHQVSFQFGIALKFNNLGKKLEIAYYNRINPSTFS